MANFIELKETYNPVTAQGERLKYVNVDHIVHITEWQQTEANKGRIKTIKTRILLTTGEILEVKEPIKTVMEKINA